MDYSTLAWLGLIGFGFVIGLSSGPAALVRIGIGLIMLAGLGVLLANTSGHERLAYWFVIAILAVVVAFLMALLGAVIGSAVRNLFRRRDTTPRDLEPAR